MVTYKKARQGYKFVLTELGMEVGKVRHKFSDDYINKKAFIHSVPTAWVDKGYVKEVKIDG